MSVTVRRMRQEDIPQVVEIEKMAFTRPWSKSVFKATLLLPYAAYYVAVEHNLEESGLVENSSPHEQGKFPQTAFPQAEPFREKIVGMCGVKKVFEDGEISNVAVHPACRGRGISRQMLEMLMREAQEDGVTAFTLEVRAGNIPAVSLYRSLGFSTEGVRPRFYEDPVEDCLIMWRR